MAMPQLAPPHLLVIDDDSPIGDTLDLLFTEEGYLVHAARSLSEALALIDQQALQFILSDLLHKDLDDLFAAVEILRRQAHPSPVGLITGWPLAVEEVMARGFAFVVSKPFELDELVSQVAASLDRPLSAEQEQQALVAQRYFAALNARDWDQVANLCTDDVIYALPGTSAFARTVTGKAAFRAYTESTFNAFPDAWFEEVHIYGQSLGVAARYVVRWQGPGGSAQQQSGGVVFQFAGDQIRQIGVRLNDNQLEGLGEDLPGIE